MDMETKLILAFVIVAGLGLVAMILGFIRDIKVANIDREKFKAEQVEKASAEIDADPISTDELGCPPGVVAEEQDDEIDGDKPEDILPPGGFERPTVQRLDADGVLSEGFNLNDAGTLCLVEHHHTFQDAVIVKTNIKGVACTRRIDGKIVSQTDDKVCIQVGESGPLLDFPMAEVEKVIPKGSKVACKFALVEG